MNLLVAYAGVSTIVIFVLLVSKEYNHVPVTSQHEKQKVITPKYIVQIENERFRCKEFHKANFPVLLDCVSLFNGRKIDKIYNPANVLME